MAITLLIVLTALLVCMLDVKAHPALPRANLPAASNAQTSITLLFQNNLNASDDVNHVGALLLDAFPQSHAESACAALGESLLPSSTLRAHQSDFLPALSYNAYAGRAAPIQLYYISDGVVAVAETLGDLTFQPWPLGGIPLPVLCTQSSNQDQPGNAVATSSNEVTIEAGGNAYVGFRNQKSFRFLGIPYADQPARFEYSSLYTGQGQTLDATAYGSQCAQAGGVGSEDCLFLNIQTPYLPKVGNTAQLRPVMFWIHGGGFTGGTGADPGSDGGNLASRENIVVVTINYRLSTLGFFAVPGTDVKGNYGIADQIVALQWTINNIAAFGGDPHRITIIGESAGAGSVRVLLGSPPAVNLFQGAVAMSNLGGGVALGLSGDYATTYSSYLTIAGSYAQAGQQVFTGVGCTQSTLDAQLACLDSASANAIVSLPTVARYVVQDGHYVTTEDLDVLDPGNPGVAHVPIVFGNAANDGASFSTYPRPPVTTEQEGIAAALGISDEEAQSVIDSGLFPLYNTGNITLDAFNVSQRVATDLQFRCVDQATVYAGATTGTFPATYYYQMDRTEGGYDPNDLGGPPVAPGYPNGDPNLPYFRLHGSDMPWVFGNIGVLRDADDLWSVQLVSGYFAAFVKTGNPNPDQGYLMVRDYTRTLEGVRMPGGTWGKVTGADGPMMFMDWPSQEGEFVDVPQCAWLGYGSGYYLQGGT